MRSTASVLHLDLDAFFASVEQRDKPSLRGKPVIVGGLGQRGVVSTASYEARVFGVHSAMPMGEARRRCPHAAFLGVRFGAYRVASRLVMAELLALSPLVEPLSIDEAFCDLAAGPARQLDDDSVVTLARELKGRVSEVTGGVRCSIGLGSSKFIAKLATELGKPDGLRLIAPGTEVDTIAPLPVKVIPGVGPVTAERLRRLGVNTVADLSRVSQHELERELGQAAATSLRALAEARDDRPVDPQREAKSISVEDTFETDIVDRGELVGYVRRCARLVTDRLQKAGLFARTITVKLRLGDFTTSTRSRTLDGATDRLDVITSVAETIFAALDVSYGVRLLGVGVSGLTEVAQEQLFDLEPTAAAAPDAVSVTPAAERRPPSWIPGADVTHDEHGPGWVWGSGLGRVTVRFETADTGPGPVRTFALGDPALRLTPVLPPETPS